MTRIDLWCTVCRDVIEVETHLGTKPYHPLCCGQEMQVYFGNMSEAPLVNYGFRPHRYNNPDDRGIAQYQFEHL